MVHLDIYEEDIQWVAMCLFGSDKSIRMDAPYFQSWKLCFGKFSANIWVEMAE